MYMRLQDPKKGATRFTSTKPPNEIIASIEEVAKPLGFDVQTRNFKMKMKGDKEGRKGHLSVATQVGDSALSHDSNVEIFSSITNRTS
jgi:hypothetical protein